MTKQEHINEKSIWKSIKDEGLIGSFRWVHGSVLGKSGGPLAKLVSRRTVFIGIRGPNVQLPLVNLIISLKKKTQTKETNRKWMGGTFLARPEALSDGTGDFPPQVLARSWALVPAGSFKHFIDSLNFCTALALWKLFRLRHFDRPILWHFLLRWVCQAEATCVNRAPSTVLPQSNPWASACTAAMLASLAACSSSFYSE